MESFIGLLLLICSVYGLHELSLRAAEKRIERLEANDQIMTERLKRLKILD